MLLFMWSSAWNALSFMTHRIAASVSGVNYPWVDIGIAGEHLVLAATELGLGTCWIGWIKSRVVAKICWLAGVHKAGGRYHGGLRVRPRCRHDSSVPAQTTGGTGAVVVRYYLVAPGFESACPLSW